MPSTTEEILDRASFSNPSGAGGSPIGETTAPPPGILERLPDGMKDKLPDELVDELLAGARTEEEIVGPGGLLSQLTKRLVERAMEVELTDHLGFEAHQEPPGGTGNTRNGSTPKTLVTEHGPVEIKTPRDRTGTFEPRIVRKRQRRFEGFDEKILALYARGMSTRDIEAHLRELYGVSVGRDLISRVTDAVMDDARAWQQRALEDVYPVLFLDALVLKIRDSGSVQRKACYLALGVGMDGERDVLGMWFQDTEGSKFWMQVLTELKQRGVRDILICCVDGLKGFPEAIEAIYPETVVQTCIVHLIRHSLRYVPRRQYDQVVKDLKPIYTAIDADAALQALEAFDQKWGAQLPVITKAWRDSWEHVIPFMAFPPEVRRVIYTTDESVKGRASILGCFRLMDRSPGRRRGPQIASCGLDVGDGRSWSPVSGVRERRRLATSLRLGVGRGYASAWAWSTPERSAGSGTEACRAACPTEGL